MKKNIDGSEVIDKTKINSLEVKLHNMQHSYI